MIRAHNSHNSEMIEIWVLKEDLKRINMTASDLQSRIYEILEGSVL